MKRAAKRKASTHSLMRELLAAYEQNAHHVNLFRKQVVEALTSSKRLMSQVHSIKSRLKEPEHLRDSLQRKLKKADEKHPFEIRPENLLVKVNDLAGVRILHLYTRQIREIDAALREVLSEQKFALLEGPCARTWDDESREFFTECGFEILSSPTLYTSVHYVAGSASRTMVTCEIQVRTLMEEVWGEVDHSLNYPHKAESLACREQLKVLARVTSSATRLVDAIFRTAEDHEMQRARKGSRPRRGGKHRPGRLPPKGGRGGEALR